MRRVEWVVAVLAAAVLGGCGSDDKDPVKPPVTPGYPDPSSPQNVLEAMVMSYERRDSTEYKSVYDTSYVGTSTNLSDPPGNQISTFQFADEAAHIAALAKSTTINRISLDFGLKSSWTRLSSDNVSHPEWAMIQVSYYRGVIDDGSTTYEFQSINPMTFAFSPTVTAPGDTTWKIVRWTEVGQGI